MALSLSATPCEETVARWGVGLFSQVASDRMRCNGLKLCQEGSGWILGKIYSQ